MEIGKHIGLLQPLFYLGLALFSCHELDAVVHHEWRLIPGLSGISDESGLIIFILLHIPLFTVLFWLSGHHVDEIRLRSQLAIDAFLLVHALIHLSLSDHDRYEFVPPVEQITVYGGAFIGIIHAIVAWPLWRPAIQK